MLSRMISVVPILVVSACLSTGEDGELSTVAQQTVMTGAPLPGISAEAFNAARDAFLRDETAADGLGPIFNNTACGRCHTLGGIGGAGVQINRHFGRFVDGKFDPLASEGGDTRSLFSLGTFNNGSTV